MSKIKGETYTLKENKDEANSQSNSTIMVLYNISRNLTKKHLTEIFSAYGDIKSVVWPKDEDSHLLKNYLFIEFTNRKDAEKAALYFGGGQIDGLVVRTEILMYPKEKKEGKSRSSSSKRRRRSKSINDKQVEHKNGKPHKRSRSRNRHHRRSSREYENKERKRHDLKR